MKGLRSMNNEYYPNITLKKIFGIIWKRFLDILLVLIVVTFAGFLVAKITLKTTYNSTLSISSTKSIGPSLQQTVSDVAKSGDMALKTYEAVIEKGVSKDSVSAEEIQKGISTSYSQASYVIKITYSSSNKETCDLILNTLGEITVDYCAGPSSKYNDLKNSLFIMDAASAPTKAADKTFLYTMIGAFIGLVGSTVFFIAFDLLRDRFLTVDDGSTLGAPALLIKNYKTKFLWYKKDNSVLEECSKIVCNSIDVLSDKNGVSTLGLFTNKDLSVCVNTAKELSQFYSKNNKKVLCIDLNMHEQSSFENEQSEVVLDKKGKLFKESELVNYLYFDKQEFPEPAEFKKIFKSILKEYSSKYDYVLFIFPPVQKYPDILMVGKELNGCFGCFKMDVDRRDFAFESIIILKDKGISPSGIILSDTIK